MSSSSLLQKVRYHNEKVATPSAAQWVLLIFLSYCVYYRWLVVEFSIEVGHFYM